MCLWVMRYFVDWGTLKAFSRSKMLIISRFSLSKRRDPSFILVFLFTHASKIHGVKDHLDEIVGKKSEDLDEKLTTIAKVNSFLVYWVLLHYSEEEFLVVGVLCDHWLMLATLRLFCLAQHKLNIHCVLVFKSNCMFLFTFTLPSFILPPFDVMLSWEILEN